MMKLRSWQLSNLSKLYCCVLLLLHWARRRRRVNRLAFLYMYTYICVCVTKDEDAAVYCLTAGILS